MDNDAKSYWERFDDLQREDAERDPIALQAAKGIKRLLPDAYVYKIRNNCYTAAYGWAQAFIDADGVLVREWGGYHKPDQTEAVVQALKEQSEYWEKKHGYRLTYEHHSSTKSLVDIQEIL